MRRKLVLGIDRPPHGRDNDYKMSGC